MAAHPKVGVGYNAQVAVDAKHKLIAEQQVTNAGTDLGFLAETAGAAKDILGVERIDVVADMGYYMGEDIAAGERAGITPYVARPQRGTAVGDGRFPRSGSATMKPRIAITARPSNGSIHGTAGFRAVISSCNIQTRAPVAAAD